MVDRPKVHNYVTKFADLITKRAAFATAGKDAAVWETLIGEIVPYNLHLKAIKHVAIAMEGA